MVANRDIKPGETILIERPITIHPAAIMASVDHPRGPWGAFEDIYEDGFPVLGETERSVYMDLWNCKPLSGTLGNKICGIARTNGLHTPLGRSKDFSGVYPTISRCNHSCGPNASARFDEETMAMRLFSRRPIAPGEQITTSYVGTANPCAIRQAELKMKYLFNCECNFCKPSKPSRSSRLLRHPYWNAANQLTRQNLDVAAEIYASDYRGSQISLCLSHARDLWAEWLSPSSKQSDGDLLQFHEDALVIIAQEGMELMRISHIAYLAHASAALEDEDGFRRWGNILISLSEWTKGREGIDQKRTWQDWVQDPMASPAWGLRIKAKGNAQNIPRA
ncbi:SET domain-containing protein [Rickenella mellea]|uniref:SET domain-containing protein n=1 Tax=Rickenella mellea TaxID=50990 RepID=A0A4Y7Q9V0_9AGAM|nr:SET domain-containing protein [Rickenella mellea]